MFPLLWLSFAFLAGLILNGVILVPWWVWLICIGVSLASTIVEWIFRRRRFEKWWRKFAPLPLGAIACFFFLGALRFPLPSSIPLPDQLFYYTGQNGTLTGRIASQPEATERSQSFTFSVTRFTDSSGESIEINGTAVIYTTSTQPFEYGDLAALTGTINSPGVNSTTGYQDYLQRKGITAEVSYPKIILLQKGANTILALLLRLRLYCEQVIRKIFTQPEAALVDGVLLGRAGDLPDSLISAYQATGTAHIFAVSGFNIAIMAGVFSAIFKRIFSRWYAAIMAILGIIFYSLLVGGSPSVVRAAIMGCLGVVAQMIGRRSAGITSLAFTAAIMCLLNPYLPWDVSFQLTFMATLGLMLFATPMQERLEGWLAKKMPSEKARQWAAPISEYFLLTFAAQLMTLPVLAYHFHRISLSSVLANPLVLPAQPLLMVLGLVATIGGMIFIPIGKILAWITWPLAAWTNRVVAWLSSWGGNFSFNSISLWTILAFYLVIIFLVIFYKKWKTQVTMTVGLIASGLITLFIWQGALARPDGRLHMTILSIQDQAALLIQTPKGNRILVNSAPSTEELGSALDQRLSIFDHRLKAVILTNDTAASLNALNNVFDNLPVDVVYWGLQSDTSASKSLQKQLANLNIPVHPLKTGDQLSLDDSVILTVVSQTETGMAMRLEYGNMSLLIPAGKTSIPKSDTRGVNLLLLGDDDLRRKSVSEWNSIGSTIFWIEPQIVSPAPQWISLAQKEWLEIQTDGSGIWITSK